MNMSINVVKYSLHFNMKAICYMNKMSDSVRIREAK